MNVDMTCKSCGSYSDTVVAIAKLVSGATVHPVYCTECGSYNAKFVSKKFAESWRCSTRKEFVKIELKHRSWLKQNKLFSPCEVCGTEGVELHHWAPGHLFGAEADTWPTSWLCRNCHKRWHDIVTPNMCKKAGMIS